MTAYAHEFLLPGTTVWVLTQPFAFRKTYRVDQGRVREVSLSEHGVRYWVFGAEGRPDGYYSAFAAVPTQRIFESEEAAQMECDRLNAEQEVPQ